MNSQTIHQVQENSCITATYANQILHTAAKRVGITKNISYHTLRRSYATHLHEAGYSLRDIQLLMGHSSSRTTERYIRVSNKHIATIQNPLDNLVGFNNNTNFDNNQSIKQQLAISEGRIKQEFPL